MSATLWHRCPYAQQQKFGLHPCTKWHWKTCAIQDHKPRDQGEVLPNCTSNDRQTDPGAVCLPAPSPMVFSLCVVLTVAARADFVRELPNTESWPESVDQGETTTLVCGLPLL